MKIMYAALACGALTCSLPIAAQTPLVVVDQPSVNSTLRAGTPVRLRLLTALTSKQAKTGQIIDLEAVDDVMVDGHIVIPRGSAARGEITFAKSTGMWGKSGKLDTQVTSVRVNGTEIALRGTVAQKGETGSVGVIGAIAFLPIAGFFVTGTSAELPAGTNYNAFVVNDMPLAFAGPAAATASVYAVTAPVPRTVTIGTPVVASASTGATVVPTAVLTAVVANK